VLRLCVCSNVARQPWCDQVRSSEPLIDFVRLGAIRCTNQMRVRERWHKSDLRETSPALLHLGDHSGTQRFGRFSVLL